MWTPEMKAAYVNSQAACALLEMEGMKAANSQHEDCQPYDENAFQAVIEKYGIHHNGVLRVVNEW